MREKVIAHLTSTARAHARERLLLDLLEHETQHQGQVIRSVYVLGGSFPESWVQRWALEQPG
jgi:hypothetical protein